MANYDFVVVSEGMKVKSPKEFVKVFTDLGFEESCYDKDNDKVYVGSYDQAYNDSMQVVKKDGKVIGGADLDYGMYNNFEDYATDKGLEDLNKDNYELIDLVEYVQEQLQDGSYFYMTEVGHEKLRYADGWSLVITKDKCEYFSLGAIVGKYLKKEGF